MLRWPIGGSTPDNDGPGLSLPDPDLFSLPPSVPPPPKKVEAAPPKRDTMPSPEEPVHRDTLEAPPARDTLPGPAPAPESGAARARYHSELAKMPADARCELAGRASLEDVQALCFDPLPKVIAALVKNPHFNVEHARLVAREHQNPRGLEQIVRKKAFRRDGEVGRLLLRNIQSGPRILTVLIGSKPLAQIHQIGMDRSVPEQTRNMGKKLLRQQWPNRDSSEKVRLILKTEGRCLASLIGCALDSRSTAMLASKPMMNTTLMRNLARWPSTPPQIIRSMYKSPFAKRNAGLKKLLSQHPNFPSDCKYGR